MESSSLYAFVASVSEGGALRVEENLGQGYVRLRVSEAERRQAKHDIQHVEDIVIELLRNARDAGATAVYVASSQEEGVRTLTVLDDGCGIPSDMRERVFEARVTSKLDSMCVDRWGIHGRGMALYSIRQNTLEAGVVASGERLGTSIRVKADTSQLPERADQSTWPAVERTEDGAYACVRGPHNIVRAVCEFALEERHAVSVFLGSPSEVVATLYAAGSTSLDAAQLLFLDSEDALPVTQRPACAVDAADLMSIAASVGLDISERTAHRVLSGSIRPVRSVSSTLLRSRTPASTAPKEVDLSHDRRGLKIASEDLEAFARAMERDFGELGSRYYLSLQDPPRIRVGHDRITVTFDVSEEDT